MTTERFAQLMRDDRQELTSEEKKQGWHFCQDWDGLLVGPGCGERESCLCGTHTEPTPMTKTLQDLSPDDIRRLEPGVEIRRLVCEAVDA